MTDHDPTNSQQETPLVAGDELRAEPQAFNQLPVRVLDEVTRQFRSARNDILRYGVWNIRNLSEEEFNRSDDRKLLGYFAQDLLETRFINKGRRIDLIQLWNWFDDQMSGAVPLLLGGEEMYLNIQDKDLEKVRKRIAEIRGFLPVLRDGDLEGFKRVKYKLRRTVMRLTYDLHHLSKRLEKYRKQSGMARSAPASSAASDNMAAHQEDMREQMTEESESNHEDDHD
ncbi:MAG: hypothetical protein WBX15_09240 [Thermoanaerobaculia bacterium]